MEIVKSSLEIFHEENEKWNHQVLHSSFSGMCDNAENNAIGEEKKTE